ncbi:sodium- and chloride-dependent glycine transporter 2-like [Littorina saxatilis]|uniref:sodium- and chloride-dependent glycine transporter 2-like n=1 Tax=Littorina saxatilis TaxID=31220 RepID=UPI0038B4F843
MCNPQKAYVRHLNGSCLSNNTVVGVWNFSLFQQHTGKKPVLAETFYLESEVAGQIGVTRDTMSDMQLHLLLSLFIVWFIICLGLIVDLRGIIHCIIIPVVFPFFVLLFLLIRSFTLLDTDMVVNHYLRPQLQQFAIPEMWCHVIQHNIFSLSLDSGTIIALSSYNRFHDTLFRPVIITVCVDACTSFVAAFIVFAQLDEIDFIQSSIKSGYSIAFEMYTRSVTYHKDASFLSIVFFLAMFLMALTAIVENCRSILIAMTDQWPSLVRRQIPAAVLFCIVCFLLGLPFVTRGGMLLGKLADDYMLTFSPNLTTLLTLIAFTLIYGTDRLYRDLKLMTGNPPSLFWKYVWWALIPVLFSLTCVR